MLFNAKIFAVLATLLVAVHAQDSTTDTGAPTDTTSPTDTTPSPTDTAPPGATPSLSPCLLNCVTTAAAAAGCSSFSDLACVCTNTNFQASAAACLQANCTTADLQAAQALQASECAALTSGSPSGSAATSTPATTAKTTTSTAPSKPTTSGASSTTAASSAKGKSQFGNDAVVGGVVALAGAVLGALVL